MQRARCYLLGETAVALELEPSVVLESQQRIWGLAQRLSHHEKVVDAIPDMNDITVVLRCPQGVAQEAIDRLQRWWEESLALEPESRLLTIPVVYGGEAGSDLGVVVQHSGLSEEQVAELHASVEYLVWFIGFQPGPLYPGGLPPALATPRCAEPRVWVPAGSAGIGGAQTGTYPLTTPDGWQLLGRTALMPLDPVRKKPALLRVGDKIRFVSQKEGVCQP